MDATTITIIVIALIIVAIVIAAIAYFAYKAGFRFTEAEVNTGLFKGKAVRTPADAKAEPPANPAPSPRTKARQIAEDGGKVTGSTIQAPADSGADLEQKAKGKGSQIDRSGIDLRS